MSDNLLEKFFQEFYAKIVELKDIQPRGSVEAIQTAIEQLFHSQAVYSNNLVNCTSAHYAMTAFADEFFTGFEWEGQNEWMRFLLEERLFKTHKAGQLLFDKIEETIVSNSDLAMAQMYLNILGLGFTGKYRNNIRYIRRVKDALFTMLYKKPPTLVVESEMNVVKAEQIDNDFYLDAYTSFPLVVSSLYLVSSCILWVYCSAPLYKFLYAQDS